MKESVKYFIILIILVVFSSGCEKFSERFLEPIESTGDATVIIESISIGVFDSKILEELAGGSYSDTIINGISGTAMVSGEKVVTDEVSCGDDCLESSSIIDISVDFDSYRIMINNGRETTIDGTVEYFESSTTTLVEGFYISSGYVKIEGEAVDIKLFEDEDSGMKDNISFRVTGDTPRLLTGWCTPENGIRYQF